MVARGVWSGRRGFARSRFSSTLRGGSRTRGAGAGEELGSLALLGRGLPWTLVTLGDAGGVCIGFTGERGLSSPARGQGYPGEPGARGQERPGAGVATCGGGGFG